MIKYEECEYCGYVHINTICPYDKESYSPEDYKNAERSILDIPMEDKLRHAKNLGPNWASIISGLGDQ